MIFAGLDRTIRTFVVCVFVFFAAAGCTPEAQKEEAPGPIHQVELRDIVEYRRESGILKSFRIMAIVPRGERETLVAAPVKEGDFVRKGDVLFRFDTSRIAGKIDLLQARIEALRLKLQVLGGHRERVEKTDARQRVVQAEQAFDDAKRALAVQEQLVKQGLASPSDLEQLRSQVKTGALGLDLARTRQAELDDHRRSPEIAEREATLMEFEHELGELKKLKEDSVGTAPFDGRILWIDEFVSSMVSSSLESTVNYSGEMKPIMIVADTRTMKVVGNFFESDIASIKVGQKALVSAEHVPGKIFEGEVARVGEFGRRHGQTSTLPVEVTVENSESLLKPGLTAEIRIMVAEKLAVPAIPVEYITYRGGGAQVLLLEKGGRRRLQEVETGTGDEYFVEILSGLEVNDRIVLD